MSDLPQDWPLVDPFDDGIRPAGAPDACFYCWQKIGEPHRRDCVIIKKTIRFRYVVELDMEVPHHWTEENIQKDADPWDLFFSLDDLLGTAVSYSAEYTGVIDNAARRALTRDAN